MFFTTSTDCKSIIINFLSLSEFVSIEKSKIITPFGNTILHRYTKQLEYNCTFISDVVLHGSLILTKYMIQNKDIQKDVTAINYASMNGHLHIVKYLYGKLGWNCTTNAIDWASLNGHLHVIKYLHEVVRAKCTVRSMYDACKYGHLHVVKYLYKKVKLFSYCVMEFSMEYACGYGHLDIVKYLIEIVKINFTSWSLACTIENDHIDILKYFLSINNNVSDTYIKDIAERYNSKKIISFLESKEKSNCCIS